MVLRVAEVEQSPAVAEAGGYLSAEGKERFTLIAGLLGGGCFIAQIVLPLVVMIFVMGGMMAFSTSWMRHADPQLSAYYARRIWYVERNLSQQSSDKPLLKTIDPGSEADPVTRTELEGELPMLLASRNRLWLVSASSMGHVNGDAVSYEPLRVRLGDLSLPFLHEDHPAVVQHTPTGTTLMVYRDGLWHEEQRLEFPDQFGTRFRENFQVARAANDELHFFVQVGDTVYRRGRLAPGGELELLDEAVVASSHHGWRALALGDRVLVVSLTSTVQGQRVVGRVYDGAKWSISFEIQQGLANDLGAVALDDGQVAVLTGALSGGVRVMEVKEGKVTKTTRHGARSPFPRGMMAAMFLPHAFTVLLPLALALILSRLMNRYRIVEFASGQRRVRQASLARRAVAQAVDAVIVFAPAVLVFVFMWDHFFDVDRLLGVAASPLWLTVDFLLTAMGWPLSCFFAFAWLEGRWGWTPGKAAMGIRVVGIDLEPCGFGRALLRNLLKLVDGFFNFMVGVMLVALTENWQRVGDMAARTLVIDARHARLE